MPEMILIRCLLSMAHQRVVAVKSDERGEITEKVIIAIFAALAIAVGAIIVAKVTEKANSIPVQ